MAVEQGHSSIGEVPGLQVSLLNPNWGLPLGMPVVLPLHTLVLVFLNPSFLYQSLKFTLRSWVRNMIRTAASNSECSPPELGKLETVSQALSTTLPGVYPHMSPRP